MARLGLDFRVSGRIGTKVRCLQPELSQVAHSSLKAAIEHRQKLQMLVKLPRRNQRFVRTSIPVFFLSTGQKQGEC